MKGVEELFRGLEKAVTTVKAAGYAVKRTEKASLHNDYGHLTSQEGIEIFGSAIFDPANRQRWTSEYRAVAWGRMVYDKVTDNGRKPLGFTTDGERKLVAQGIAKGLDEHMIDVGFVRRADEFDLG